ncbi:MAG: response regulator transcription factor [Myxococcaceae bacterium]|nr:response regulator transcription factor [Myxococcaceae bacterium]
MSDDAQVRVYVVEDQAPLLKNLLKALSLFPELTVVGTAQEGEAAVAEIVELQPQVVLMDLELPGIDGIEVTRRVRARTTAVEILVLTSFDDEVKVYEAVKAGAAGYLVKRVGPEKIRSAIREVLDGGTVIEAVIAKRFWNYFHSVQGKPQQTTNPWGLNEKELDVLRYVAKGLSNAEVGEVMAMERRTVRTHLSHLYKKMGVNSHVEAVVLALKAGLVEL